MSEFLKSDIDKKLSAWRDFFSRNAGAARNLKEKNKDLAWLLSPEDASIRSTVPWRVFVELGLPAPTTDFRKYLDYQALTFDGLRARNGHAVVYRGDIPGLVKKGMYSTEFMDTLTTLDQIMALQDTESKNPFLTKEQLLANMMGNHSQVGGTAFISTTGTYEVAREWADRGAGVVYVITVPIERVIKNIYSRADDSHHENEYLINDYIFPDAINAKE